MRILRFFLSLVLFSVVLAGGLSIWGWALFTKPGPLAADRAIVIPQGAGLQGIADTLGREGVLDEPRVFMIGAKVSGAARRLRAGEFMFAAGASARDVMHTLQFGETVVRKVTFAEGLTSTQITNRLSAVEGLTGEINQPPAEGALLPETYYFSFGDSRQAIVDRMTASMKETVDALWSERDSNLPLKTPEEALVLASIIEKETAVAEERALVAGVFVNRLRRGMRLQSDPTVAYGIAPEGLKRPLTRSDLRQPTPYNTYVIKGLPPAPIANPGRSSIAAALSPANTPYLYFVADGTGGHAFARTLAEHNRNVAKWRKIQRSKTK